MHKKIYKILIFTIIICTLFSCCVSHAGTGKENDSDGKEIVTIFNGESISREEILNRLKDLETDNPFEMTLSGFVLQFGDSIMEQLTYMYKERISVDRIVFNNVLAINPNFFEFAKGNLEMPNATKILCGIINAWYEVFNGIAIIAYLLVLIYVGIQTILRNSKSKSKIL